MTDTFNPDTSAYLTAYLTKREAGGWDTEDDRGRIMTKIINVDAHDDDQCRDMLEATAERLRISYDDMIDHSDRTYAMVTDFMAKHKDLTVVEIFEDRDDLPYVDEFGLPQECIPNDYWLLYARVKNITVENILPLFLLALGQDSTYNDDVGVVNFSCCL